MGGGLGGFCGIFGKMLGILEVELESGTLKDSTDRRAVGYGGMPKRGMYKEALGVASLTAVANS